VMVLYGGFNEAVDMVAQPRVLQFNPAILMEGGIDLTSPSGGTPGILDVWVDYQPFATPP